MKKLLTILIGLTLALTATAQNFQSRSLLGQDVGAIYITNISSYVTNLSSSVSTGNSNQPTVIITNLAGTYISGNTNQFVNALGIAPLFIDRNAQYQVGPSTNSCILLGVGSAGANATNNIYLEIVAVPDGRAEDTTTTTNLYSTTANTSVAGNWRFPFPSSAYPGCKSIMLRKIYLGTATSQAASQFVITNISLCGFAP